MDEELINVNKKEDDLSNKFKYEDFINSDIKFEKKLNSLFINTPNSCNINKINMKPPNLNFSPVNLNQIKTLELNESYNIPEKNKIENLDGILTDKKKKKLFNVKNLKNKNNYTKTFYWDKLNFFKTNSFLNIDDYNNLFSQKKIDNHFHCNCNSSNCLKLYCECLKKNDYCSEFCKCIDCKNNIDNFKERNEIIKKFIKKKKNNFLLKNNLDTSKNSKNQITCNCTKGCRKKYCECFKMDTFCINSCKCFNCKNKPKKNNLKLKK